MGGHREGEPAPDLRAGALRVVFAGTPAVALPSLRALLESRHEVVAVVTRPDAPAGRGRHERRSPVAALAEEAGVPVLSPVRPREPDFLAALAALEPDCCPVVAYGALIPRAALDIPRHGWVNLHFSLLPAWRGAAPVQAALLHGDEVTGASTFQIEVGLDTGPVYGVVTEPVRPRDTAGDLLERLSRSGADLLVRTVDGIEDGVISDPEEIDRALRRVGLHVRSLFSLPFWFLWQFVSGVAAFHSTSGGVAFWAHVGGFVAGMALGPAMQIRRSTRPEWA